MKRLYFVRHGESEMNVQGLFAGHTETALTDTGKAQAQKAGISARKLSINCIISSPLSRAHETARIIAKSIGYPIEKILLDDDLKERFYGAMEGKPYDLVKRNNDFSGSESISQLLRRADKVLDKIKSIEADNILVVSHGSFGRALRHHVTLDFPFTHPRRIPNAEIFQLI